MNAAVDRLKLVEIGKSFGSVRALDGVTMTIRPGTVHGLLGENGAGKSTLLNILSGVLTPSSGHVEIDGRPVSGHGPVAARRAGVAMIHQELQHVPELTVAQNMFLGHPLKAAGGLLVARRWSPRELFILPQAFCILVLSLQNGCIIFYSGTCGIQQPEQLFKIYNKAGNCCNCIKCGCHDSYTCICKWVSACSK